GFIISFEALSICMEHSFIFFAAIDFLAMSISCMAIFFIAGSFMASIWVFIFIIEALSHFIMSAAKAGANTMVLSAAAARIVLIIRRSFHGFARRERPIEPQTRTSSLEDKCKSTLSRAIEM